MPHPTQPAVVLLTILTLTLASARPSTGQEFAVDTSGAGALIDQALHHSEVMKNLEYLTDVIGPRLTGSPAAHQANEWALARFRGYGLSGQLETWMFEGRWERGAMWMRLVSPRPHDVIAASWAWAPGTGGKTLRGPVVRIDASQPESLAAYRSKVRGAFVMMRAPAFVWNSDGPPMTAADSVRLRERFAAFARLRDADSATRARRQQYDVDVPFILRNGGALAVLVDGAKEQALLTMSGSPRRVLPLPQIVIAHEDYALFDRLLATGTTPLVEASVSNEMSDDSIPQWNTVAEIRGSERPGQAVIVGAHLDSWDLATGATDNCAGAMAALEAARIIAQSGLKPRRTIRFVLFTGEEQGLMGSHEYARMHAGEADSTQAVLVLDNGTGAVTGQALQGRKDLEGVWRAVLAPLHALGADSVVDRNKNGTDHLSFLPYGIPGFNFNQLERGYNHTHHSQSDTYDKAIAEDLMQASAVLAVSAYELANLPALLPRGARQPVPSLQAQAPSDSVYKPERPRPRSRVRLP